MAINKRLSQLNANRYGSCKSAANATWQAGQVGKLTSTGLTTVTATADSPIGILLNNHLDAMTRVIVSEAHGPIDFRALAGATATVTLLHNNLVAAGYKVMAGATAVAETTDYTIDTTTGIITAVVSGKLDSLGGSYANGGEITVTYKYNMTVAELNGFLDNKGQVVGGPGMANNFDEVLSTLETTFAGDGNVIYTDQFDSSLDWSAAVGGNVYFSAAAIFTTTGTTNVIGKVVSIPTATQPWLGVLITL